MKTITGYPAATKANATLCKHCHRFVDLDAEGNTYRDGSVAHEDCAYAIEFDRANKADFRD